MPPATRIPASPIPGLFFARPTCTPHCALVPDPHLRSKSGRSVAPGDIHVTRTSLVAPFHKAMDIASLESKENKGFRHASTSDSQSTTASSIRASQRSTLLSASCASTSKGGKRRPCIVIQMQRSSARVFLMGTFGGSRTQDLPQELRPYLAIMSSCNCKWKGNWLEKWRNGHAHSIPEWYQEDGNIQYIVPIVHEIGMDAVEERWADRMPSRDNNAEGYHMDMTNMNLLLRHSERMGGDLKMRCVSREYRKRLRRAARKPPAANAPSLNSQRLIGGMSVHAQCDFGVGNFLLDNRDHRFGRPRSSRLVLVAQWNV
ncbi:uncharacterized protein SCHCODRAFT_02484951 [Schizophyllum commune H4-8]|nr:uncharacterized protein SCHCODRAFT_02484951 [Schizophyllum commune H4-8]KAI5900291.1 hypothetical protein SCHCODRAFT_02484951 [Schizophyllum commune H4-8]